MKFEEWATANWPYSEDAWIAAKAAWQAAQQAERERIMKALDAALMLRGGIPSDALLLARAAIAKYKEEPNEL